MACGGDDRGTPVRPAGRGRGAGRRFGRFGSRVGVLSVRRRILAVRGHEDDRLGRHSPPLFLIGCDVPRWTSAQPGSLWLTAPPVRSNANTYCTISCFRGRTAALLAAGVCLAVTWLPFLVSSGPFWREQRRLCVFCMGKKSAEQITPKL